MKTQDSTKKLIASLESALIVWYRPSFLHITSPDEDNDIQVLIASRIFNNKEVHHRIKMVMATIDAYCPDLFKDRLIIIQAYAPNEMEEILEYVFDDDTSDLAPKEI